MRYTSLFKKYRKQDTRKVFAHFPYKGDAGETWEKPFERLVSTAKPEQWNFQRPEIQNQYRNQRRLP